MTETNADTAATDSQAPHPGTQSMPQWNVGELIEPPVFTRRNWFAMLGPGLLMGGAAIGGGEWLVGPIVTAKYGGALLWLATLSILGQVIYNIEISRYTLYTGEPIFTGKFRTLPGPMFWVFIYLLLDFGAIFPYLAANAAIPLASVMLGEIPNAATGQWNVFSSDLVVSHKLLLRLLAYAIFLAAMIPLIFGGKIYNALKGLMTFKIVTVMGFLLIVGLIFPKAELNTWKEIFSGFFKIGNVPIRTVEDRNGNGIRDPDEDWDGDNRLDVMEPSLKLKFGTSLSDDYATDIDQDGKPDPMLEIGRDEKDKPIFWPDLDEDGQPDGTVTIDTDGDGQPDGTYTLVRGDGGKNILYRNEDNELHPFIDVDSDGIRDGDNIDNIFVALFQGRGFPKIDFTMIAFLSALVAISGSGGLSNTPISNYTRDQGWGMGHHVGAIPSVVGGQDIQLSHVGTVFEPTDEALPRWKRWYRHVVRDQLVIWMPACFFGLALPSMLSVEFLARGTEADSWVAAAMTAGAVQERVGGSLGPIFWFMTLFCGFLVLAPSMATSADGIIRRWLDVFWTASGTLRRVDPKNIRYVYFGVLTVYAIFGMGMLSLDQAPTTLLTIATTIFNFALGFSCWHTLALNLILLPKQLQPNWFVRISMFLAGLFFLTVATISAMQTFGYL